MFVSITSTFRVCVCAQSLPRENEQISLTLRSIDCATSPYDGAWKPGCVEMAGKIGGEVAFAVPWFLNCEII